MFKKSTWLHLRIPFSYFLLPIYLWAISLSPNLNESGLGLLFLILHFFIYPGSNAYNSYFDKDEGSIGGLKNPPKVDKNVFYIAQLFEAIGIFAALFLFDGYTVGIMVLAYVFVSRAYSHPSIRLKKKPIISWLIAGFFQGAWVVWIVYIGLNGYDLFSILKPKIFLGGLLASGILWGSYPMTQIYQHEEDQKRGDITLSFILGIKNTFLFTGVFFASASLGFVLYLSTYFNLKFGFIFLAFMAPVVTYFGWWFLKTIRNQEMANYTNTMRLNIISATCLGGFYLYLFFNSTQVLNVVGVY